MPNLSKTSPFTRHAAVLGIVLSAATALTTATPSPSYAATTKSAAKKVTKKTTKKTAKKTAVTTTAAPTTTLVPVPSTDPSGSTTVPSAPPSTAPVTTTTFPQPAAVFGPCSDSTLECANVSVPLDPKNPAGERITLFVSRRRATGPGTRLGVIFVNPGGPGGATYDLVRGATRYLTSEVLARFDVIGVDPRGTSRSAPLACDVRSPSEATTVATPGAVTSAERARLAYEAFATRCAKTDAARLQFLDTETAARDLDAVRAAIGEDKISYVGMSYGTYLGAVYRSLFPTRVRTMILDSAVDPARFGVNQILDTAAATERALDGFLDECASGRLNPCAFNDGSDLRAKYLKVREDYVSASRRGRSSGEQVFDSTISDLVGYPRNGWPVLGRALQELFTKQPANFNSLPTDSRSTDDGEDITPLDRFSTATNFAVNCRDGLLPRDSAAYQTIFDQTPVVAPRFAGLRNDAEVAFTCLTWPAAVIPLVPLTPQPTAPTLVIGNTFDLTTPYTWSQSLAATLNAPLLTRNGGGHVAITKSECVRQAAARFFIDLTTPAPGTICSPSLENPS